MRAAAIISTAINNAKQRLFYLTCHCFEYSSVSQFYTHPAHIQAWMTGRILLRTESLRKGRRGLEGIELGIRKGIIVAERQYCRENIQRKICIISGQIRNKRKANKQAASHDDAVGSRTWSMPSEHQDRERCAGKPQQKPEVGSSTCRLP